MTKITRRWDMTRDDVQSSFRFENYFTKHGVLGFVASYQWLVPPIQTCGQAGAALAGLRRRFEPAGGRPSLSVCERDAVLRTCISANLLWAVMARERTRIIVIMASVKPQSGRSSPRLFHLPFLQTSRE